jgi:ankyrin repeat protein
MNLQKEISEFLLIRLQKDRNNDDLNKLSNFLEKGIEDLTLHDSIMELIQSIKDNHGRTPLHYAAKWGLLYSCESLIYRHGLELTEDNNGLTPLHYAARFGHFHVTQVILKIITEKNVGFEG